MQVAALEKMTDLPGEKPFDRSPGFYERDNRQYRGRNPITQGVLEAKFDTLLPPWLVKGKSVLDLGACLGAAGHWALFYGAKSYTGVELQAEYVSIARELLTPWGDQAKVVQADIRSHLAELADGSYEIILAAGVIYCFVDPDVIVREMCRVAKEAVLIESNYPELVKYYKLYQTNLLMVEYRFSQDVNMADGNYSLSGLAACPSVGALDLFFMINGFANREGVLKFPVNADSLVYGEYAQRDNKLPARFATRYFRADNIRALRTLEQNMPDGTGVRRAWDADPIYVEGRDTYQERSEAVANEVTPWTFDAVVADSFEKIADVSIPHYRGVIEKTIEIIRKSGKENPRIIDVGSAVGTTLKRLHEAGFANLYGVDSSESMLQRSFNKAVLIHSEQFPASYAPFDVVIANWVLHFIRDRERYLESIRASMADGGLLILSEKVISSPLAHELYHDLKRSNGLSEDEIRKKQQQLAGVLIPYPLTWYIETLYGLGFKSVDVVDADYSFVTLLAQL